MTMDENTRAKYEEKIKTLLAMAKKKKNVLEYQEISDHSQIYIWKKNRWMRFWMRWKRAVSTCCALPMMTISRMKNCFCRMKTKWTWKTLI